MQKFSKGILFFGTLLIARSALFWFRFTFSHYLPRLNYRALQESLSTWDDLLARWGVWDAVLTLLVWLVSYLIGESVFKSAGLAVEAGAERLWLASAAGLALLSLLIFVAAACRILYIPVVSVLLLIVISMHLGRVREIAGNLSDIRLKFMFSALSIANFFLLSYTVFVLGIGYISALGPEIEYDPLAIYLTEAKTYIQRHGLTFLPDIPHPIFPRAIQMFFTLGMLLNGETTAKLINYLLGLLTVIGAYALGQRYVSRTAGLLAAAILSSTPMFLWTMHTLHLEAGFTCFVFLSLYTTLLWLETERKEWFWFAVASAAFSLGTRYQALFPLGSLAVVVLSHRWFARKSFSIAMGDAVRFLLFSMAGLLVPWGAVSFVETHNPIFPFLNNIFHSPYWNADLTRTALAQQMDSGVRVTLANWWDVVGNFWNLTIHGEKFHGNIGPFYLMLIPLLMFQRRIPRAIKQILIFSSAYWLLWIFTAQHVRYYLGALPGLAIVAACSVSGLVEMVRRNIHQTAAVSVCAMLALAAIGSSPLFESYGTSSRYGEPIVETLPSKYLLRQETREQYLTRYVLEYPLIQRFNALPGRKKLLFWWNVGPRAFYADSASAYVFSPLFVQLVGDNAARLHSALQADGITHVMIGEVDDQLQLLADPERDFVQRYLRRIGENNSFVLYEVSPEPLTQERTTYVFLNHLRHARITAPSEPAGKSNESYRAVISLSNDDSRLALAIVPPASVEFGVNLPENPIMRFAIGRRWPPCVSPGLFQLWATDAAGEKHLLFDREISTPNATQDLGWYDEELDLKTFANQHVTITFSTELKLPGACDWLLWADPQIISRPAAVQAQGSAVPED